MSTCVLVCGCTIRLAAGGSTEAAMLALQEQLHEKEMRLTDVQLEALSSAHQLQQLQDTITRMKVLYLACRAYFRKFTKKRYRNREFPKGEGLGKTTRSRQHSAISTTNVNLSN